MFANLLPWLNILLTVLVSLLALYFLLVVIAISFATFFNNSLRKNAKALLVIMATKFDNLKKLNNIIKKYEPNGNEKIDKAIGDIDINAFNHPDTMTCKQVYNKLTYINNELDFICRRNETLMKHNEVKATKEASNEMESVYRNIIANYNADVLGYNYWVRFLPARWLFKVFKINTKELI